MIKVIKERNLSKIIRWVEETPVSCKCSCGALLLIEKPGEDCKIKMISNSVYIHFTCPECGRKVALDRTVSAHRSLKLGPPQ